MANISVKNYLTGRAANPAEGIRHLAPNMPVISVRELIRSTFGYVFSLDNFIIYNTRSVQNDTDQVFFSLKIDDRKFPAFTKWIGDVNNGNHAVNMVIDPTIVIEPGSKVTFCYLILNSYELDLDLDLVHNVLNLLCDALGDTINYLMGEPVIGSAIAFALKELTSFITGTLSRNGVVAIDTIGTENIPLTGQSLDILTATTGYHTETRQYPGKLSTDSAAYKQLYSNSDYSVTWSIARRSLRCVPELSTDRSPFAVAYRKNNEDYISVFMADKFGCAWERRIQNDRQYFIYRDSPQNAVMVGSLYAVATPTGYPGFLAIGNDGGLFELAQSKNSWLWNDHKTNPGLTDMLDPNMCVIKLSTGYISVFVVGEAGGLWELPLIGGVEDWVYRDSPPNTSAIALSSIIDQSGQVRIFITAKNGHLYQYRPGSNMPWSDHGSPPGASPIGSPSFAAAPRGYIVGLVLGHNGHIFELSSTDGINFTWKDHGLPPHAIDPTDPEKLILPGLGTGSPSLIATPDGYLGALIVGNNGDLNELYWYNGSWNWISIGPPLGKSPNRIAASDPSYISTPSGYRGAFVCGIDGHLYELYHTGTNHDWAWKDHSLS